MNAAAIEGKFITYVHDTTAVLSALLLVVADIEIELKADLFAKN